MDKTLTYQQRIDKKFNKSGLGKTRKEKLFDKLNDQLDDEYLIIFSKYFNVDENLVESEHIINYVLDRFPQKEINEAVKEIDYMHSKGIDVEKYLNENPIRFCPNCKKRIEPSEKFCIFCGGKVYEDPVCPNCKNKADPSDKFCYYCGTKLK